GQRALLRRRRVVDGRPGQLCGGDAGGEAVGPRRRRRHCQPRLPLRQERAMKSLMQFVQSSMLVLLVAAPLAAMAADTPLPRDSVYHLALPLTGQDGVTRDWSTRRGKPQVVSMFYTSCQYICPLIVDAGKAIEHSLTPEQRSRLGIVL